MLPWLLPVGLLGTVALISLSNGFGYLLAMAWGWLVFPYVAACIHSRSRTHRGRGSNGNRSRDVDTHYWRTKYR